MNHLKCKETKKESENTVNTIYLRTEKVYFSHNEKNRTHSYREMKIIPFRSQEPQESMIKAGAVNINDELFAKGSSFSQKKNPTVGPQERYNIAH